MKAKLILHHDDPPCYAKLRADGFCEFCNLHPDMQSTCFHPYCPICNVELQKMKCPVCKKKYKESSI